MKPIKLTSLLKEDESKAKAMWNRLDADSKEDILLRFVKNPDQAEKMVTMAWDRLPNSIAGNKDFQDAITDQKGLRETNIKKELKSLIKEEVRNILAEESKYYPFKFDTLDMYVGEQGKYKYVFPKSQRKYDDWSAFGASRPHIGDAVQSMLRDKGIKDAYYDPDAPATVPGWAIRTSAPLATVAKALSGKGTMNEAGTAYGEKEAIAMIWEDPGNKIESALKQVKGYESTVQGEPRGKVLYIYFTNEQAAKKGAKVLSQLVPGPQYDKNIKSEDFGGVSTEWFIQVKS